MRSVSFGCLVLLIMITVLTGASLSAEKGTGCASISVFKSQSLYRMAKLIWTVGSSLNPESTFQILRSDSFIEGPYEEIATIPYDPQKQSYTYFDKRIGTESKYYYKLVISNTQETCDPVAARPFFSPPTT